MPIHRGGWPFAGPPNTQFTLNTQSPQAKGLVFWLPGSMYHYRELIGQSALTPVNSPSQVNDGRFGKVFEFDDASTEYLSSSDPPVTAAPFTLAAWFNSDDASDFQGCVSVGNGGSNNNYWVLGVGLGYAWFRPRTTSHVDLYSSTSYNTGKWHLAVAVEASATDHRCFLDGGGKDTDSTSLAPANADKVYVGMDVRDALSWGMSGKLANVCVWNRALSDAEVLDLYQNPWDLYQPVIPWALPIPLAAPPTPPDDKLPDKIRIARTYQIPIHQLQL